MMIKKKPYSPREIEKKWQKFWETEKLFVAKIDETKPKYYILDMFPYPSGEGLHVGHPVGYIATDVIARYKRQKGFNVLHPMGWDSFGLPAEQYAIRTGIHPKDATERNIDTYRRQLKAMGLSYDWSREIATSDPNYYKWTQWIFSLLYNKGLAYEGEVSVNFCPQLGTVLANEEVENGVSVDGGYPVEKKPLRQWILKITDYAERLLDGLDQLDWPDHLKRLQRNWIGKSVGAAVSFKLENAPDILIECFTTRADTLFGVTFLALAPEHPMVMEITTEDQRDAVAAYVEEAMQKSDIQRTDLSKEKTGVFTGAFAINPISQKKVPIWIADYVLAGYGSGALMGVAAHDERDFAFANCYNLPIIPVIEGEEENPSGCYLGEGRYINSKNDEIDLSTAKNRDEGEKLVVDYLAKRGMGRQKTTYKLRDWLFSRQRYWGEPFPLIHFPDGSKRVLDLDELPLTLPEVDDYKPSPDGKSPLERATSWMEHLDEKEGKMGRRESNIMPQWAGSCWYYLRFCDPFNEKAAWSKEAEKYWMPVDLYVGGVEHAVLHLLYARFWHKVLFDLGLVSTDEPFTSLKNQGLVTAHSYKKKQGGYVSPAQVEEKEGGYYDKASGEKVEKLLEKMSKSKLNGVSPEPICEEYGADALRIYELFMTPFDKEKIWNTKGISGAKRFLQRVYDLVQSDKVSDKETKEALYLINPLIRSVEEDIEGFHFNTAIAKMMEFLNAFTPLSTYPKKVLKQLIQLIYPFAPHFGEECFVMLGEEPGAIIQTPFPPSDLRYCEVSEVTIVFQVNGKRRSEGKFSKQMSKEEIEKKGREEVDKYLQGKEIVKVIFVPERLMNFVVR